MVNNFKINKAFHGAWNAFHPKLEKYYKLFIVLFIISSCSKEIELELVNNRALVLNSIFRPDSVFAFRLSISTSPLENYIPINDTFHLILFEEENILADTTFIGDYISLNAYPKVNKKYTVEITSTDLPVIRAFDSIPECVPITDALLIFPAGVDPYGDAIIEADISFTDPTNESNYYEILIFSSDGEINYWNYYGDVEITDPVLINEGDLDYYPTSFFFSNELFDGEKCTIKIKDGGRSLYSEQPKQYVSLRSVSKSYYLYRKYYTRHAYNQQFQGDFLDLIFKGEPQNMYSNIEGGYGIFAGFQETTSEVTYQKK